MRVLGLDDAAAFNGDVQNFGHIDDLAFVEIVDSTGAAFVTAILDLGGGPFEAEIAAIRTPAGSERSALTIAPEAAGGSHCVPPAPGDCLPFASRPICSTLRLGHDRRTEPAVVIVALNLAREICPDGRGHLLRFRTVLGPELGLNHLLPCPRHLVAMGVAQEAEQAGVLRRRSLWCVAVLTHAQMMPPAGAAATWLPRAGSASRRGPRTARMLASGA